MNHHVRVGYLLTYYGGMLTPKQREMMRLAYEEDWSLSEIASAYEVSRQAVHDAIHRAETSLEEMDESLHLVEKLPAVQRLLEDCLGEADEDTVKQNIRQALELLKGEDNHGI